MVGLNKNCEIKAAPKLPDKAFLYLGGVDPNITVIQLKNYLTQQKVNILNLHSLNTNYKTLKISQSFKITLLKCDYDKIMDASFWPEGVIIKDWVNYRKPTNTRDNDNPQSSEPSSKRRREHILAPTLPPVITVPNKINDKLVTLDKPCLDDVMNLDPVILPIDIN